MAGKKIGTDTAQYKQETDKVSQLVSAVSNAKTALKSKEDNLNVSGVDRIYKLYDMIISIMDSYGTLAHHDIGEFDQLSVNIQVLDQDVGKKK